MMEKAKTGKQAPVFGRLMRTTGNLGAKRDSNPLFPKEPCHVFFLFVFLVPSDPVIVFDTVDSNK